MKLEDVFYFSIKKRQHPTVFELAQKAVTASEANHQNSVEIQRRLYLLTRSHGSEHLRKCADFIAEAVVFNELLGQGKEPIWVPENGVLPSPDFQYFSDNRQIPVEVKHLNSPRNEHEALASGEVLSGSVNPDYDIGIEQKIVDFVTSAKRKFIGHNKHVNRMDNDDSGVLYLLFSKSVDASLADYMSRQTKMEQRIKTIAKPMISDNIALLVRDLDTPIPQ